MKRFLRSLLFASPAMLFFLFIDTATQLVFKAASAGLDETLDMLAFSLLALRSPLAWAGIGCYFLTFVAWMGVLRRMPLSKAFPLTAATYVTVPLAAWVIFAEPVTLAQGAAITLIIGGLLLIGQGEAYIEEHQHDA